MWRSVPLAALVAVLLLTGIAAAHSPAATPVVPPARASVAPAGGAASPPPGGTSPTPASTSVPAVAPSAPGGAAASAPGVVAPRTGAGVDEIVAEVRRATARYLDIAKAREDGFIQASGMEPRHGYHFIRPDVQAFSAATGVDLGRPPMLIYIERDGAWQLAGVEYALPAPPAANPFPGARWDWHEASCHYRDFRELPAARVGECAPRHPESDSPFVMWHPAFAVAHVWAWYPNPAGPFAAENAYLAVYGGTPTATGHKHPRNPAELYYSEITHRVAGTVLIILAALSLLERRRPSWRYRPSAVLWIVFGCYLFVTSDPESWPAGPRPFLEIFSDGLVLQHKLLALIPITFGVVQLLRLRTVLVPALAVLGGISLFFHFHDGTFHLDTIYLQHAAMGVTAAGLGVALLVSRLKRHGEHVMTWAWPSFLTLLGLVLLFYVER